MNLPFPDGAPLICNVITGKIEENKDNKIHNINHLDEGTFAQFLLSVSSKIDDERLLFNVNDGRCHELLLEVLCSWSGRH